MKVNNFSIKFLFGRVQENRGINWELSFGGRFKLGLDELINGKRKEISESLLELIIYISWLSGKNHIKSRFRGII
jgi:hypothetical protein